MKTKINTVLLSHLSDALIEIGYEGGLMAKSRIRFAKWILLKYPDTNQEFDPDVEYELFIKTEGRNGKRKENKTDQAGD